MFIEIPAFARVAVPNRRKQISLVLAMLLVGNCANLKAQATDPALDSNQQALAAKPAKRDFKFPSESAYSPKSDLEIVAKLDELLAEIWKRAGVEPAKPAPDGKWCRRIYLDLIGRTPTVEELAAFTNSRDKAKRVELVERLMSAEYAEEYARNCTSVWTNILIGRVGGMQPGSLVNRQGMQQYLRETFLQNKPYDRFVYELLTATGESRPGNPNYNGAVNFLADKLGGAGITAASLATARCSEIFMGVRLQCVQCHNHPFNSWKQNQYWELNSFFRQTASLRRFEGGETATFVDVADQDFAGDADQPTEAAVFYEDSSRILKVAYPVFTDKNGQRTEIPRSGFIDDIQRRRELAKLLVQSEYLPDAIVNSTWARFLGYGFTKPLDDMGPHNLPVYPELLAHLTKEFKDSGYNLKRLSIWIALSRPYALDAKPKSSEDDPTQGLPPLFSHFYSRQMQPEELYESLLTTTEGPARTREAILQRESDRDTWVANLVLAQLYVTENKESTTFDGSIPQTLVMFNGDLTRRATPTDENGMLWKLAHDSRLSNLQKLDRLFLAALARTSTKQEQAAIQEIFRSRGDDGTAALQDVWWSLINSNAYILNH